jgi:glutamyl-tRNA synthetase
VRLRLPDEGETVVHDLIRGEVSFRNELLDDLVIARGDGTPLYNFAVAVDDAEMGITDVVRGDDHLSNTPKQLLVLDALGIEPPRYAHLPLLHGPDGKKLSKRHGAASLEELRDAGYLPAAVRNYLALLGWGSEDDETLLATDALIERFEVERVGTASAVFDERKLRWMNGRYMREMNGADYEERVATHLAEVDPAAAKAFAAAPAERRRHACEIVGDKAQTLDEVWPLIGFLFTEPVSDERAWEKVMRPESAPLLEMALAEIREADPYDAATLEQRLGAAVEASGAKPKAVYQPIRVALTGTTVSPGIFDSLAALGKAESVDRIEAALARLRAASGPGG